MTNSEASTDWFRGIVPPLATPLRSLDTLDVDALQILIDHVVSGGAHAVFALGSTGEAPSLSVDLRCSFIREVCDATDARVPVVVNVSDTAFAHSLLLAEESAQAGASAVVLSPPCYFPIDQKQLIDYARKFCERAPLPVVLYNVPQFAHNSFEPDSVGELSYLPNVIGIKNSNGSLEYLEQVRSRVAHRKEFKLLVGNEETLLPAVKAGADGGVCGGANMFPQIFVQLYEAAISGQDAEAQRLQTLVAQISKAVYTYGAAETSYLRGLKRALFLLGLIQDVLAEPLQNFTSRECAEFEKRFRFLLDAMEMAETGITK